MITEYHAKYLAHELTKKTVGDNVARLSRSLFDAKVDLNPHQIEAALFALRSPISSGVLLADEVGLGKTIEAGIVLCQYWAERKRKLIIICPASIRKQWAIELEEKFNLPAIVLVQGTYKTIKKEGKGSPFQQDVIVITSFNFAAKMQLEMRPIQWDLVVIDEAHKLRTAYRESNKIGQAIKWATEERRKLLLTATPLQITLLELYGITLAKNLGTSIAMLERHYSHLEVLHRAEALAGRPDWKRSRRSKGSTRIIELDGHLGHDAMEIEADGELIAGAELTINRANRPGTCLVPRLGCLTPKLIFLPVSQAMTYLRHFGWTLTFEASKVR